MAAVSRRWYAHRPTNVCETGPDCSHPRASSAMVLLAAVIPSTHESPCYFSALRILRRSNPCCFLHLASSGLRADTAGRRNARGATSSILYHLGGTYSGESNCFERALIHSARKPYSISSSFILVNECFELKPTTPGITANRSTR